MRNLSIVTTTLLLLAACGGSGTEAGTASDGAAAPASVADTRTPPPGAADAGMAGRTEEFVDPDDQSMVLLYYSLAGLNPPLDSWAADDPHVVGAPVPERPAARDARRAELEAGLKAAGKVGRLRFSVQTAIGYYDPTYGEFTIGALQPSSVIEFRDLGQRVGVRFGNARVAQLWSATAGQAEQIGDRYGRPFNARLDVLARIHSVQPDARGGTIIADVLEYELHEYVTDALIVHNDVPQQ